MDTSTTGRQNQLFLPQRCCLILWGAHCDEIVTAILASTLRAAGVRVWLVGMSGRQLAGTYGLRIQPDLTTAEALTVVRWASCIVIPCERNLLARFVNDPRLDELLTRAAHAQRQFVVSPDLCEQPGDVPPYNLPNAVPYPQGVALFEFAAALAILLTES